VTGATLASVLATGRETRQTAAPPPASSTPGPAAVATDGALSALPRPAATAASGAPARVAAERAAPAPGSVWMPRVEDTGSIDSGDWRDTVAAALGRRVAERLPLDAGALHTHVAEGPRPDTPAAPAAVSSEPELQGWDGGQFWFGPRGLVRVKEAER
jgi:hypothetical protein